jgi:class 3 adenylate cyclase
LKQLDSDVQYAWNGDVALAYRVVGGGPIDLLYLPGFTSNVELDWDGPAQGRFLRRLASFTRVISMDRRGWGCSDRLSVGSFPPLETLMDDVRVVMDAAHSGKTAIFAAGDNGFLALLFAASHPDRVTALVLYDCTPSFVRRHDMPWQPTREELEREAERSRGWGTREFARQAFARACPSALNDVGEFEWYVRWIRLSGTPGSALAESERYMETDLRNVLPSIHVPTLVLNRTDTVGEPPETARYLASNIDGAKLVVLPGPDLAFWTGDSDAIVDETEEFLTGVRHPLEHNRILATVLFTDIVGSTERQASLGDRGWKDLIERHHAIVRETLARYGGVENDTAGDGFFATFDGPARAIRCAQEAGGRIRDLGLEIRAGIHTGECELINDKVGGIAVTIGARISALAGPFETLISQTVKDLVAGSGLTFEDAGEHALKGIPDRWHLYRVATSP